MNTTQLSDLSIEGLLLVPMARTASSLCLDLRKDGMMHIGVGWIDVHHPCEEHIRLIVHGVMPEALLTPESLRNLMVKLMQWLEIPANETWEIHASAPRNRIGVENSVDAQGMTDRISTTRRFASPKLED